MASDGVIIGLENVWRVVSEVFSSSFWLGVGERVSLAMVMMGSR